MLWLQDKGILFICIIFLHKFLIDLPLAHVGNARNEDVQELLHVEDVHLECQRALDLVGRDLLHVLVIVENTAK